MTVPISMFRISGRVSNLLLKDRVQFHTGGSPGGADAIDDEFSVDFACHAIGPVGLCDQRIADDAAPVRIEPLHLRNFGVQRLTAVGFEIGKIRCDVVTPGKIRFEHTPVVGCCVASNRGLLIDDVDERTLQCDARFENAQHLLLVVDRHL